MDLEARIDVLRQTPYFRAIPPGELAALAGALHVRSFGAGQTVFRKGDLSDGLFIVLSGQVRTLTASPAGREQVLKVFGVGRTFGDISVFDGGSQPADAEALVDSEIAVVPQAALVGTLAGHPEAAVEVIRLFASRLRAYKQFVEDLSLRSVSMRLARLLVDRARGTPTLVEDSASSRLDYTQDEIATMVGTVREVVQRALKGLEHAGLVDLARGRIHVIDADALENWMDATQKPA